MLISAQVRSISKFCSLAVSASLRIVVHHRQFLRSRIPRKDRQVDLGDTGPVDRGCDSSARRLASILETDCDDRARRRARIRVDLVPNMAGIQQVQLLGGVGVLFRSDSRPVSRGGRPNSSRNGLVMLASARQMERWSWGMKVQGSGIRLEYDSRRSRDLADRVNQDLGVQAAKRIVREMVFGLRAVRGWDATSADRSPSSGSDGRCASDRNRHRPVRAASNASNSRIRGRIVAGGCRPARE